jgi:hypothetical protein
LNALIKLLAERVQILNLLILQFAPFCWYLLSLKTQIFSSVFRSQNPESLRRNTEFQTHMGQIKITTNFMELNPSWEAASCTVTQEVFYIMILQTDSHIPRSIYWNRSVCPSVCMHETTREERNGFSWKFDVGEFY